MLDDIVRYLRCPVCGEDVASAGGALRCGQGHSFDVARQGYVSLLVGSRPPGTADTAAMVAARARFLEAGHYAPLAAAVARAVRERAGQETAPTERESSTDSGDGAGMRAYRGAGAPVVVDAGAGTGYYLAAVLDTVQKAVGIAFDVSKHAVRRAARAHPRAGALVADVWRPLPIRSGVADVVIDVFAPRNGPEFLRVLRPGGALVVVTPAKAHLSPLVEELGLLSVDEEKERRVARSLQGFAEVDRRTVEFDMELEHGEIAEVVQMGPSAWHTDSAALDERIGRFLSQNVAKRQEKVAVQAAFHLSIFESTP
ncbi:putative RNA methyltransferase [Nonomuraea pusilla]|uniref:putative RNA methyltransferase n=1 Tax=Nonomuraea pusilla TaxID=46177 RepID=UPI00332B1BA0